MSACNYLSQHREVLVAKLWCNYPVCFKEIKATPLQSTSTFGLVSTGHVGLKHGHLENKTIQHILRSEVSMTCTTNFLIVLLVPFRAMDDVSLIYWQVARHMSIDKP